MTTAGRTNSVSGSLGDGTTRTYSTGILYDAGSRMTKEQFGTTTPIYNKLFYNSRGLTYGTTNNNGNLQSIGYSGGGLSYTQSFGYDALNRLATSNENSGVSWSQTNGYDQYGNRWIDYGGGVHNLSFSSSTNRITTGGYCYDSAGNLTNDTIGCKHHHILRETLYGRDSQSGRRTRGGEVSERTAR